MHASRHTCGIQHGAFSVPLALVHHAHIPIAADGRCTRGTTGLHTAKPHMLPDPRRFVVMPKTPVALFAVCPVHGAKP